MRLYAMPLCRHFMLVLYAKVYTRFMPRVHRLALYQVFLQVVRVCNIKRHLPNHHHIHRFLSTQVYSVICQFGPGGGSSVQFAWVQFGPGGGRSSPGRSSSWIQFFPFALCWLMPWHCSALCWCYVMLVACPGCAWGQHKASVKPAQDSGGEK